MNILYAIISKVIYDVYYAEENEGIYFNRNIVGAGRYQHDACYGCGLHETENASH